MTLRPMTLRLMNILLAVALATSLAPSAQAKTKHRKRIHPPAPAAVDLWRTPSSQAPARMIEIRPGLWISSYGCVVDEGYGRLMPCDMDDARQ